MVSNFVDKIRIGAKEQSKKNIIPRRRKSEDAVGLTALRPKRCICLGCMKNNER